MTIRFNSEAAVLEPVDHHGFVCLFSDTCDSSRSGRKKVDIIESGVSVRRGSGRARGLVRVFNYVSGCGTRLVCDNQLLYK